MPKAKESIAEKSSKKTTPIRAKKTVTLADLTDALTDVKQELKQYTDSSNTDLKKYVDKVALKLLQEIHNLDKKREVESKQNFDRVLTILDRMSHNYQTHEQERVVTTVRIEPTEVRLKEHDRRLSVLEQAH